MRRSLLLALALCGLATGAAACSCSGSRPPEIGEAACSNAIDDDGDMLTDCADPACQLFAWCSARPDAGPRDASTPDASVDAGDVGELACSEPLDLVIVLDVSSSMTDDVARLRDLAGPLMESAREASTSAQVSLVVFVDDAESVMDCAPFETADALAAELDQWRVFTATNRSPVSDIENVDCVENSLDAISTAITGCEWRDGARIVLHVTDDTFAERPAVLSGPFGPGVLVASTYLEVSDALAREDITFVAVAANGAGASCGGPMTSPDVGRGFHTPFGTDVSLPTRTGGEAWDLRAVRDGSFDLAAAIDGLLSRRACAP